MIGSSLLTEVCPIKSSLPLVSYNEINFNGKLKCKRIMGSNAAFYVFGKARLEMSPTFGKIGQHNMNRHLLIKF